MASIRYIRPVGNQLEATFDDGSVVLLLHTAGELWLPTNQQGVGQGSGGEGPSAPQTGQNPGSVAAPIDDYPWPNAPQNDMSPLRYSYRDCTDFAAWRINRDNGCLHAPWAWTWAQLRIENGNAIGWRHDWQLHGWSVDIAPTPGCLGWFGTKAGSQGHINYVQSVATDGTVHMEEYNWGQAHHQAYNERDAAPGSAYYPDSFLAMPH